MLLGSGPILAIGAGRRAGIAFFQALTQIQEMTLTFVPKIVAIFLGCWRRAPSSTRTLHRLSDRVFDLIASGSI